MARRRRSKESRLVRKLSSRNIEKKTPIFTGGFLPNLSGDHSAGNTDTPNNNRAIANKKYVDDEDAAADTHITSDGKDHSDVVLNNTHRTSNGSDHTFLDQSVISGATPTFGDIKGETKTTSFTILDPNAAYDIDTQIFVMWAKSALTVTKIICELDADPATEVTGDLKYADTFLGLASATVINDFDTTDGTRTDTSITSGAVAAGKAIYIQFDAQPIAAINQMTFYIEWDYD